MKQYEKDMMIDIVAFEMQLAEIRGDEGTIRVLDKIKQEFEKVFHVYPEE